MITIINSILLTVDILMAENYDLDNIVTPIDVNLFEKLLVETNFEPKRREYIVQGFRNGFSIQYEGPTMRTDQSRNLRLQIGTQLDLWNKVMTEVQLKRYAGPFPHIPERFNNSYVQSPIGLTKKAGFTEDGRQKTRL